MNAYERDQISIASSNTITTIILRESKCNKRLSDTRRNHESQRNYIKASVSQSSAFAWFTGVTISRTLDETKTAFHV